MSVAYADTLEEIVGDPTSVRIDERTAIAVTVPRQVTTGTRLVVTGVVEVRAGRRAKSRPVRLVELTAGRWVDLTAGRSTRRGVLRLAVPAGRTARSRVLQVRAPRSGGLAAVRTGRLRVSVVAPDPTPTLPPTEEPPTEEPPTEEPPTEEPPAEPALGSPTDWTFLFDDGGARWNPCDSISWVYNPDGGYAGSLADVQEAFDRITVRTGLDFSYAGTSTYVPWTDSEPPPADIALGWATPAEVPALSGSTVGLGGGEAWHAPAGSDVAYRIFRGEVALDETAMAQLRPGYDVSGTSTWGQVMVHEVMHVLGLGHAQGAEQVMYPAVASTNHRLGAGDLAGLTRIGSSYGCLS